jgi:hypothetical protein
MYTIALVVSAPSSLPKCTASLAGTTAYVQSPAGLYSCVSNNWVPIPCTTVLAGAVAYASSSQTLLACVSGQWTSIALPQGSPGPAGSPGPQGKPGDAGATSLVVQLPVAAGGSACPYGGTEIESGVDQNGNKVLDSVEVMSISWVCNGAPGTNGAPATPVQITSEPPGPNCAAGGERIDVGTQTAYVCNGTSGASTGGGSSPDGGAGGSTPDAGHPLPMCAPAPSGVTPATITISGTAIMVNVAGGAVQVAGAQVRVLGRDGSILGTGTTDAMGSFGIQIATGGAPVSAIVQVSQTGSLVTYVDVVTPFASDVYVGAAQLFDSKLIASIGQLHPVDLQKGQILVQVVDCQSQPIAGASVSADPAPEDVLYTNTNGSGATGSDGVALLLDLPPGDVRLSAVLGGVSFTGPTVKAVAGAIVQTPLTLNPTPGP